jgi:hypothetical protein
MSQDWDLDTILKHSRSLKIDDDLAVKKYYEIFRYLKTKDEYKNDENKTINDCVIRTTNWLTAYSNSDQFKPNSKTEKE